MKNERRREKKKYAKSQMFTRMDAKLNHKPQSPGKVTCNAQIGNARNKNWNIPLQQYFDTFSV